MRAAVVDLGSCTFHTIIADVDPYGIRKVVFTRKRAVRIADDRSLAAETIDDQLARLNARRPAPCRVIATGVFRERADLRALAEHACEGHGFELELLDANEEGRLVWIGVSTELAGSHRSLAVVDLGAASLQIGIGYDEPSVRSAPLGVLALRGVSPAEVRDRTHAAVAPLLAELADTPDTVALASGTARALLALGRRVGLITDVQQHVGVRTFKDLARMLTPLSSSKLAALGVPSSRRDTITNGAIVIASTLELLRKPVVYVARAAMREGALVELARSNDVRGCRHSGISADLWPGAPYNETDRALTR